MGGTFLASNALVIIHNHFTVNIACSIYRTVLLAQGASHTSIPVVVYV
jgi:hypothetical protein